MPPQRVYRVFCHWFGLTMGIDFAYFGLELVIGVINRSTKHRDLVKTEFQFCLCYSITYSPVKTVLSGHKWKNQIMGTSIVIVNERVIIRFERKLRIGTFNLSNH